MVALSLPPRLVLHFPSTSAASVPEAGGSCQGFCPKKPQNSLTPSHCCDILIRSRVDAPPQQKLTSVWDAEVVGSSPTTPRSVAQLDRALKNGFWNLRIWLLARASHERPNPAPKQRKHTTAFLEKAPFCKKGGREASCLRDSRGIDKKHPGTHVAPGCFWLFGRSISRRVT